MTQPINSVEIDRPWSGPCATTGLTMQDYEERLTGVNVPDHIKRAAVAICRAYGIKGWSDPGYIANVIAAHEAEKP